MKFARVGVAIAAAAIVVTACGGSSGGGSKALKIGITLPLSGSSLASAGPARDGALLAIKEFKHPRATRSRPSSSTTRSTASMTRSRAPRT